MSGPPDRAYNENRRFGLDPVKGDSHGTPTLEWGSGTRRPVKDLGWLMRNSKHVTDMQYENSHSNGFDASLKVRGVHPERGAFEYSVGFQDRETMRNWVGASRTKWNHVKITDHMRDGGSPQFAERPGEMNAFSTGLQEGDR